MPDDDFPKALLTQRKVLADFGDFALQSEDLDAVLTEACRLVGEALGTSRAKVLEIEPGGESLFVRAGVGWAPDVVGQVRVPMGETSSESFSIRAGAPVLTQDIRKDDRFEVPSFMKAAGVVALANVPIFLPGRRAYGLLQVDDTEPRDFTQTDTEFLRTYASLLGPVIDRLFKLRELRSTEDRFRAIVETAVDYGILTTDPEGRIVTWPAGAERVFGWSAEEAIGLSVDMTFTPEDRAKGAPEVERLTARTVGVAPDVRWHQRRDGSRVFIAGVTRPLTGPDGRLTGFVKVGQDVTERRRAEEQLQLATEAAALGIFDVDLTTGAIAWDARMRELWGAEPDEIITDARFMAGIQPDDRMVVRTALGRALDPEGDHVYRAEFRLRSREGRDERWVTALGRVHFDGPRPVRLVGTVQDVTERKGTEASLRESEEKFRTLFGSIDEGLAIHEMIYDDRGQIVDVIFREVNAAFERHTGVRGAVGRSIFDLAPGLETYWFEHYKQVARTGEPIRVENHQGDVGRWFEVYFWRVDRDGRFVGTVFTDISERKRADAALREGEERQAFLLGLSDLLQRLATPDEMKAAAMHRLGTHLGVSRAQYHEVDGSGEYYSADGIGYADGLPLLDLKYRIGQFGRFVAEDFEAGRPFRSDDLLADPRPTPEERDAYGLYGIRAGAGIPLIRGGRLVAILAVHDKRPRPWTDGEMELIRETAERVWVAVEKVRTEIAVRDSEERKAFLLTLSDALRPLADPVGIQSEAARVLGRHLGAGRAAYAEVEADGAHFAVHRDYTDGVPSFAGRYMFDTFGPALVADLRAGGTVSVADAERDARFDEAERAAYAAGQVRAAVAVPLVKGGRLDAVFFVHSPAPREWSAREAALVEETAERTWAAVERARAEAALRESEAKFRSLFESVDQGYALGEVIFDQAGRAVDVAYVEANPAAGRILGVDITGRRMNEIADWELPWYELWGRVARTGQPERREDYAAARGQWFDFYIFRPDLEDRDSGRVAVLFADVTERRRAEEALRESERRFRTLAEGMPQLVWRATEPGRWTWASPQWTEFTGQAEAESHGWGWLGPVHPDDREAARTAWERSRATEAFEADYRLREAASGGYRWFQSRATPVRDEAGRIVEWLGTTTDVQDLREMQERQAVLVAELQHRTRNLMGVVRALADKSLASSASLEDFEGRFRDRLRALGRANGLLSRLEEEDRITFDQLLGAELSAHGAVDADGQGSQVRLRGPRGVRLRSSTVQTLALGLHELATNAIKYGALSRPEGRLEVTWDLVPGKADQRLLRVDWRESGVAVERPDGPPEGDDGVAPPRRRGYGRELIEKALPYQLKAQTSYELTPEGARCTLVLPVSVGITGATEEDTDD